MHISTLNLIKALTDTDPKSLSEKLGKLFEEGGELSSKVLPYENAHATTHRFVTKENVLEEIADCMLVLMSMLYDKTVDFSLEDLEEMMIQKSYKWADLQRREAKVKYPLPYEIHVTVKLDKHSLDDFKDACNKIGVKPILLDLAGTMDDLMTSSVFMGNNGEAIREVGRISRQLGEFGFKVLREKVETVPWHPTAPSRDHLNPIMPKDCYFECHFGVRVNDVSVKRLSECLSAYTKHVHLSRSIFKKEENGNYIIMATYREYSGTYEDFNEQVKRIKDLLSVEFEVEKTIVEFSIFDTKIKHDQKWLESN